MKLGSECWDEYLHRLLEHLWLAFERYSCGSEILKIAYLSPTAGIKVPLGAS